MELEDIEKYVSTTPPRCLQGFRPVPAELPEAFDDNQKSVWKLVCSCGNDKGKFLGYSLKSVHAQYDGPECFVSPLAFECAACNKTTELLDTDHHGYHAEVSRLEGDDSGGSKLRGTGARQTFCCPKCSADVFTMTTGFVFWYVDELAEEFDGNWEDLFNVFLCYCQCTQCGHVSEPTEFGKL